MRLPGLSFLGEMGRVRSNGASLVSFCFVWGLLAQATAQTPLPPNYTVTTLGPEAYPAEMFFNTAGPPIKPVNIVAADGTLLFSEH